MFYFQRYSATYSPIGDPIPIHSAILPRQGDCIDEGGEIEDRYRYIVFEVRHILQGDSFETVVRARLAPREGRLFVLAESGFIPPLDMHSPEIGFQEQGF